MMQHNIQKKIRWLAIAAGFILLAACTAVAEPLPTDSPTLTPAPSATITPLPTATRTEPPPPTPTASQTPLPSPTATITPTALPWADTVISLENASQLVELAKWGRGQVNTYKRTQDNRLVVLSPQGVFLYEETTGTLLAEFPGAFRYLVAPGDQLAAVIFPNSLVSLVRLEDGQAVHELASPVTLPAYMCEGCSQAELQRFASFLSFQAGLAFSAGGELLAVGYPDNSIGVWNTQDGSLESLLYHDVSGIAGEMVFSEDLKHLLSSGSPLFTYPPKSVVSYWELESEMLDWYALAGGRFAPELFSPDGALFGLYFSPAGADYDVVRLHRFSDGSQIGEINGAVSARPYSPDGAYFVSSNSNNVLVWQVQPRFQLLRTLYPAVEVVSAGYSEDGSRILINAGELIYAAADFALLDESLAPRPAEAPPDQISPETWWGLEHLSWMIDLRVLDDNTLFAWGFDAPVWRWNPLSGEVLTLVHEQPRISLAGVSWDGDYAALCFADQMLVTRFDGREEAALERCLEDDVLAFSPDGQLLARGRGSQVRTFDWRAGTAVQDYLASGYPLTWMVFSGDGALLAAGGEVCGMDCKGDIHLWQVDPPQGISLEPDGSEHPFSDVTFTSDHALMFGARSAVWAWDTATGRLMGRFPGDGHTLAVSPDDTILAVGSWSGEVTLVSIAEREVIFRFSAHGVRSLAFTPDGANLITLGSDGAVRLWGIPRAGR